MRVVSIKQLPATVTASGRCYSEKEIKYEGSAGPRELLENLSRQVKAAQHVLSKSKLDPNTKSTHAMYHLSKGSGDDDTKKLEAFWYN